MIVFKTAVKRSDDDDSDDDSDDDGEQMVITAHFGIVTSLQDVTFVPTHFYRDIVVSFCYWLEASITIH